MRFLPLFLLVIIGCGPTKEEISLSKVNVVVRKEFNDKNFMDGGKTGEYDAWGTEVVWEMDKGWWNYGLYARSFGPDKLPYTHDDIVAKTLIPIERTEGVSEQYVRSLTRGFTRGIKDGMKEEEVKPLPTTPAIPKPPKK